MLDQKLAKPVASASWKVMKPHFEEFWAKSVCPHPSITRPHTTTSIAYRSDSFCANESSFPRLFKKRGKASLAVALSKRRVTSLGRSMKERKSAIPRKPAQISSCYCLVKFGNTWGDHENVSTDKTKDNAPTLIGTRPNQQI